MLEVAGAAIEKWGDHHSMQQGAFREMLERADAVTD